MLQFPSISFSPLSFWLGFLAGALFWWLFTSARKLVPEIKKWIKLQIEAINRRRTAGLEHQIRSQLLDWAQQQHLAANLCSLDQIVIEPRFIFPATDPETGGGGHFSSLTNQILPVFLDCPEIYAQFNIDTLDPLVAMRNGANLVITAQPGMGKTVALAWMTSRLIHLEEETPGSLRLPLTFHILDLNPQKYDLENPAANLVLALSNLLPSVKNQKLERFVNAFLKENQAVLLLDGLDELPPETHQKTTTWLSVLMQAFPHLQVITTGAPTYLGDLPGLGFQPVLLSSWSYADRNRFYSQWRDLWQANYATGGSAATVDDRLVMGWLVNDKRRFTPLEWCLMVWAAFDGLVLGESPTSYLEGLLDRVVPHNIPVRSLSYLSLELIQSQKPSLPYRSAAALLAKYRPSTAPVEEAFEELESAPDQRSGLKRKKKISSRDQAMSDLLESGLLKEHADEQVRLINPLLMGYLASLLPESTAIIEQSTSDWPAHELAMRFLIARDAAQGWVSKTLQSQKDILQTGIHKISRAIPYSSPTSTWRSAFMRDLVSKLHDESIPSLLRLRLINCLLIANDPSLTLLFKQLYASRSAFIRFSAVLAAGSLGFTTLLNETRQLLNDEVTEVQMAACLAIGAMDTSQTLRVIESCLSAGTEEVQQVAAEILSKDSKDGHEILKVAATSENLLVRRAAVMGLSKVKREWAQKILQKLSIEDGQWVVRSIAGHALEYTQHPERQAPRPFTKPENTEWLIQYASRQGMGVPVGQLAIDLMVDVLRRGKPEEKILALRALPQYPQNRVLEEIAQVFKKEQGPVQEAAYQALLQNYSIFQKTGMS
ncbi:MAG: NACHT domain-containing protein [Chloroflexi bacterium]|nr:NACHT domain-containing protein [Chloroflexota bacterium]